jgi:DNA-binding LacI/PurR family transcriptional regulator
VPEDVALVTFGDTTYGDLIDAPLTGLGRQDRKLGGRAALLLLDALADCPAQTTVRIGLELIVRPFCGCSAPRRVG